MLSVCEEPVDGGVDVLCELRRELDGQGTSSPEPPIACDIGVTKASAKAAAKEALKAEKAAAKEALKAEKAAAKLAAKEEAKAAKLAEREAKKDAKKLEREAAREAKKAEREAAKAAKKVSKKVAAVAKADSEPKVADEVELVVEAYESESDMVCDGAKDDVEMLRQPSTGYDALEKIEKTERDVFEEPSRFYDSYCDP